MYTALGIIFLEKSKKSMTSLYYWKLRTILLYLQAPNVPAKLMNSPIIAEEEWEDWQK